jgi:acetyltransferase-like isoleucine patch superfamily enzyme
VLNSRGLRYVLRWRLIPGGMNRTRGLATTALSRSGRCFIGHGFVRGRRCEIQRDTRSLLMLGDWCQLQLAVRLVSIASVAGDEPGTLKMGNRALVKDHAAIVAKSGTIEIGDWVAIGRRCDISCEKSRLSIGEQTRIGPDVFITTNNHEYRDSARAILEQGKRHAPVFIGRDVWVGRGVSVMPGVTIGDRAVVGAGSVVTRDVACDSVVAGSPARVIGERTSHR